jgi:dienelactone hydrolase
MQSPLNIVLFLGLLASPCFNLFANDFSTELAALDALCCLDNIPTMRNEGGNAISVSAGERKSLYFDALEYRGKATRVFAWLGIPDDASAGKTVPGIVLVQGGGGTAFKEWVEKWNARGYAAISIAVEGQTDEQLNKRPPGKWARHAWPGPSRPGIYADNEEPFKDQWMYHAVADTVLANTLIRSLPEVDAGKVGLMGISWGGIITSTVIGIDTRFAFAIPTYGAGGLHHIDNQYKRALHDDALFQAVWDPMIRISRATMPALWLSWPRDKHFSLDVHADIYLAAPGVRMVSLVPGMKHSHIHGWSRPESYAFADSIVKTGIPWCVQTSINVADSDVMVGFKCKKPLLSASLLANFGSGHTTDREWAETDAVLTAGVGGNWTVKTKLPAGVSGWFVNVKANGIDMDTDGDGLTDRFGYSDVQLVASSDYQEVLD